MQTFLIERTIPPAFDTGDPDQVARHCRWAADAYRKAGVFWLGGIVTEARMLSLAVADSPSDLDRYATLLGISASDISVRRVLRQIGPGYARPAE